MAKLDRHEIRIPGAVLDQIRTKQESGDYSRDRRFGQKRKFDGKRVSRKDKRKEERRLKKQKQQKFRTNTHSDRTRGEPRSDHEVPRNASKHDVVGSDLSSQTNGGESDPEDDPMAALRALKAHKSAETSTKKLAVGSADPGFRVVREDDLDDELSEGDLDDVLSEGDLDDELSEGDMNGPELSAEESGDEAGFDGFASSGEDDFESFDEQGSENPLGALKKLKKAGRSRGQETDQSDDEMLPEIPSDFEDLSDAEDSGSDLDQEEIDVPEEYEQSKDPLAQLKALKESKKTKTGPNGRPKTDQPVEANFVDPLDNDLEYYAKKLGLKNGKKSKLTKLNEDDVVGGLLDGLDFDESASEQSASSDSESEDELGSGEERGPKENPFVAPGTDVDADSNGEGTSDSKYIPPALRRKMAMEKGSGSETDMALRRSIKGPINRLSESNIGAIVNEINGLFLNHPRQAVNESFTSIVLESVIQQSRLLDTFVYLHAACVVATYRLQGVDFGAFFIQTLIEKLEEAKDAEGKAKEALNLTSLLSSVYALQLVSSTLLYDLIRDLIENLTEANAEILLKIIRNCGNQMRSDDPGSLKEIILQVTKKFSSLASTSTRMQFLVETISSLKNNKMASAQADSRELMVRLKKFLGNFVSSKMADPLQVSLDDIRHVDTRGKWWLVGSAWKGKQAEPEVLANVQAMNDILDAAEPNWLELAKLQRMNTDIRRAIFISIMSANDYVDAVTKLDKLALKKSQEREIPRIVVHCAVVEPAYNPYYGILALKLCESHSYRKTFQFMLWDLVKSFDGADGDDDEDDFAGFDKNSDDDDDDKLKKILNLGRLFGNLVGEGSLALHVLRTVNFLTASSELKMFMEVLMVTFFDHIGKKSQVNAIGVGLSERKSMSEQKFDDRTLIERILKAKEEPAMLRGICHFISKSVIRSDFITGRKQRKRVEWGVRSMCDITDEIVKEAGQV